jgi:hypothetical protein
MSDGRKYNVRRFAHEVNPAACAECLFRTN